jgi:hypothetical protein
LCSVKSGNVGWEVGSAIALVMFACIIDEEVW